MDPRIQAILAKYENDEKGEAEKHADKPATPEPPKTYEQWLERRPAGLQRWPDDVDIEKEFEISVASVGLGSLEEIMKDLGRHARILSIYLSLLHAIENVNTETYSIWSKSLTPEM